VVAQGGELLERLHPHVHGRLGVSAQERCRPHEVPLQRCHEDRITKLGMAVQGPRVRLAGFLAATEHGQHRPLAAGGANRHDRRGRGIGQKRLGGREHLRRWGGAPVRKDDDPAGCLATDPDRCVRARRHLRRQLDGTARVPGPELRLGQLHRGAGRRGLVPQRQELAAQLLGISDEHVERLGE
jgi:hypothetical protein